MNTGEIRTQATAVIQARADDSTPGTPRSQSCKIFILLVRNVPKL